MFGLHVGTYSAPELTMLCSKTFFFALSFVILSCHVKVRAFKQVLRKVVPLHRSYCTFALAATPTFNRESLESLSACTTGTQARKILERELLQDTSTGSGALFNSISVPPGASAKGISDGDLAIQTRLVNRKNSIIDLIELSGNRDADRASLGVLLIFLPSTIAAFVANQNLPGPEIIRFLVVWILCFAPLAFVGYGIKDAESLQNVLVGVQRRLVPSYRKRMLHHEAGHFLIGHLLGFPIKTYTSNAVKNAVSFYPLSDPGKGSQFAEQLGFDNYSIRSGTAENLRPLPSTGNVPFFGKDGRGGKIMDEQSVHRNYTENPFLKLPALNEPTNAWPYRGFDERTLDELSMISVAGVCSEILAFGDAEGGAADFSQLRQIFNSAQEEMAEREIENRIRFALGYTISQLRLHLHVVDDLVEVMERDGSVAECVLAIETCESLKEGVSTTDFERLRRDALRAEGSNWIERIFLGTNRNIDAVEDRLFEGVGGGSQKETFQLTGDEPLYLAIAIAFAFFIWASEGGLSLH